MEVLLNLYSSPSTAIEKPMSQGGVEGRQRVLFGIVEGGGAKGNYGSVEGEGGGGWGALSGLGLIRVGDAGLGFTRFRVGVGG